MAPDGVDGATTYAARGWDAAPASRGGAPDAVDAAPPHTRRLSINVYVVLNLTRWNQSQPFPSPESSYFSSPESESEYLASPRL